TGQAVYDIRHAIEWPDERRVLLSINAAPLSDELGQISGMVAAVEDVTEQVRAEEELRKHRDHLEKLVAERTTALIEANEQLQQSLIERRQAEQQIKTSLEEKEVLLKEIHHRVKNNLQVISSLLSLQAGYIKDEKALVMFHESRHRVKSMALVHERLYRSPDLARIDFAEYIRDLTTYLFRAYGVNSRQTKLKIKVADVTLGIDTAIPCGSIINELVSNSLKYAFPTGQPGQISIDLQLLADRRFALLVSDNGIGFPEELDFRKTKSLGLRLVNTLVRQLNGTIELKHDAGTKFKIMFVVL
ncbi:MAG: PAS domain S-box protein, partial [Planctomycetes bacterium]|nr:PAS domain S-box protein [Planctomycetota bacterium]